MTDLEKFHIAHSQATIALEVAQIRYNEAKKALVEELQKPVIQPQPEPQKEEK